MHILNYDVITSSRLRILFALLIFSLWHAIYYVFSFCHFGALSISVSLLTCSFHLTSYLFSSCLFFATRSIWWCWSFLQSISVCHLLKWSNLNMHNSKCFSSFFFFVNLTANQKFHCWFTFFRWFCFYYQHIFGIYRPACNQCYRKHLIRFLLLFQIIWSVHSMGC